MPNLSSVRRVVVWGLFPAFLLADHATAQADRGSLLDGQTFVGPTGE